MILAKTRYKTYNSEILIIVEVFKIWKYNLTSSWYEVLMLIEYNNLQQFIDTKNLNSKQVC